MRFYLLLILLGYTVLQAQPTIPPPTQTDEIIIDNGATGKADPNDRIRYKVTIQNTGTSGATGTQLNIVPDPRTTFVAGTFRSSPLALADSYPSTGNVGITIPVASGLKANDFDDNIPGLTITAGTFTTTQGGSIMISADGSFMYTPPAGFTGSDTYTYTLNDANGVGGGVPTTDMAIVTITVSNLIWFIDNSSVAATSDGRLTSPFKSLADFNAGSTAVGDVIYIEHTGTNYTGGIVLQDNERVYGEGHTGAANLSGVLPFTLAPNSKTLPNINGTRPILTNAAGDGVTLAQNNNLRGFDVGNCSDFGMDNIGTNSIGNLVVSEVAINNTTGGGFDASNGSGASMNAVFGSITSSGGVNGIDLTNCAGTFTVNGGTITNPTGTGVLISGGSVVFNSSGVITDDSGFAVDVDNHDSGNATFSGNITSTATGIRVQNCGGGTKLFSGSSKNLNTASNTAVTLNSNTGATINITNGGLVINSTTGMGFSATGGGTIAVTGNGNTITSTTGTALNIANTTISSSNVNFQSISKNGGINGIVINNSGTSGGLNVTGNGMVNSGGIIQNTTGDGILLTTAINVNLTDMFLSNSGVGGTASHLDASNFTGLSMTRVSTDLSTDSGILGNNLRNLTISGGTFDRGGLNNTSCNPPSANNGNGGGLDGIHITNLLGTSTVSGATFKRSNTRQFYVLNNTATNFAGTPDEITFSNNAFNTHGNIPLVPNPGTSCSGDHISVASDSGGNFRINTNNTGGANVFKTGGIAVQATGNGSGKMDANISGIISGGTIASGDANTAGVAVAGTASSSVTFNINNNQTLGTGSVGMTVNDFTSGTFSGTISNNSITHVAGPGTDALQIISHGDQPGSDGTAIITVSGNTVIGDFQRGIRSHCAFGDGILNITISGNTVNGTDPTAVALRAIEVEVGGSGGGTTNTILLNLLNNNAWMNNGNAGYRLFHRAGYTFSLKDLTGNGMDPANITNWIDNVKSNNSNGGAATTLITGAANNFTSY